MAIGGVTRLTESGLSIVEWKLFSGTLPPLNDAAWQTEFAQYQTSPQYLKVNNSFTLADFQRIFWLEYLHRLLGRVIGMTVFLGTIYFALRRRLPHPLLTRMTGICLLVGAQGTVGWIMVASGLVDQPRVAPVKLAAHLLLALALFAALLWTRWQVTADARIAAPRSAAITARFLFALALLQAMFGALVAGLRAGKTYNTYPLMDGRFIPDGLYLLTPWWRNHLENVLTVQFQHRMTALAIAAGVIAFAALNKYLGPLRAPLIATVCAQFALGVATLLTSVDLWLASLHQLIALLLIALLLRAVYRLNLISINIF